MSSNPKIDQDTYWWQDDQLQREIDATEAWTLEVHNGDVIGLNGESGEYYVRGTDSFIEKMNIAVQKNPLILEEIGDISFLDQIGALEQKPLPGFDLREP